MFQLNQSTNKNKVLTWSRDLTAIAFDMAKLFYFTCPKSEHLQYKLGAMVLLHPQYADIWLISNKEVLGLRKVFAENRGDIPDCMPEELQGDNVSDGTLK